MPRALPNPPDDVARIRKRQLRQGQSDARYTLIRPDRCEARQGAARWDRAGERLCHFETHFNVSLGSSRARSRLVVSLSPSGLGVCPPGNYGTSRITGDDAIPCFWKTHRERRAFESSPFFLSLFFPQSSSFSLLRTMQLLRLCVTLRHMARDKLIIFNGTTATIFFSGKSEREVHPQGIH